MGKPTKILHNVAVGVVLNDVLDPLIAVLISATLRFSRMASSGLGNVDLSEVLFALENVDESPEIWVVCSYIRLETAMPTFNCIVSWLIICANQNCMKIWRAGEWLLPHRSDQEI